VNTFSKTAISALLVTLALTGTAPVTASEPEPPRLEQKIPAGYLQEAQAIAKARELFGLKDFTTAEAFYAAQSIVSQDPVWHISLHKERGIGKEAGIGVVDGAFVEINARTGEPLYYERQNPDWASAERPDEAKARTTADAWLKKIAPNLYKKVAFSTITSSGTDAASSVPAGKKYMWGAATVQYLENVNGVPFENNRVSVSVDAMGRVIQFRSSFAFDSAKLPARLGFISPKLAAEKFASYTKLELRYWSPEPGKVPYTLEYYPAALAAVDAFTGQAYLPVDIEQMKGDGKILNTQGKGMLPLYAKSREEAQSIVERVLGISLKGLQLLSPPQHPSEAGAEESHWNFTWIQPSDAGETLAVDAMFNAATGQLLAASVNKRPETGKKHTLESARQEALRYLEQALPSGSYPMTQVLMYDPQASLHLPDWYDVSQGQPVKVDASFNYMFEAAHDGIPVAGRSYGVSLNTSGELLALQLPDLSEKATYASRDSVPAPAEAKAKFLQSHPLELVYDWQQVGDQIAPQGRLIYQPKQESMIATTPLP